MNPYLIAYIVGAVVFYIGSAAMYLDFEWRVTLLKLLACLFLFAPFVALIWPLALFCMAIDMADNTQLWERKW